MGASSKRCRKLAASVVIVISLLLFGQAVVTVHHAWHPSQTQHCEICALYHSGVALSAPMVVPARPTCTRVQWAPASPLSPQVQRPSSSGPRAPPLSTRFV